MGSWVVIVILQVCKYEIVKAAHGYKVELITDYLEVLLIWLHDSGSDTQLKHPLTNVRQIQDSVVIMLISSLRHTFCDNSPFPVVIMLTSSLRHTFYDNSPFPDVIIVTSSLRHTFCDDRPFPVASVSCTTKCPWLVASPGESFQSFST